MLTRQNDSRNGAPDHLRNFRLFNIHVIEDRPDELNGPSGARLGVAEDEDVILPQLKVVDPVRQLLDEEPGHDEPRVVADQVIDEGDRVAGLDPECLLRRYFRPVSR